MGGKRKKLKDTLSPPPNAPPSAAAAEDDELLDDLLTQLDSNDKTVQNVSAEVINDIQLSQLREREPQKSKKDSKTRFLERQVCVLFQVFTAQATISFSRRGKPQESFNTTLRTTPKQMPR